MATRGLQAVDQEGQGYLRSSEGCDSVLERATAEARQRWESFLQEVSR